LLKKYLHLPKLRLKRRKKKKERKSRDKVKG